MENWYDRYDGPLFVQELPDSAGQVAGNTTSERWSPFEGSAPEEKLWSFENGPQEPITFEASSIPEHPKRKCIVIGPSGSGKTGFLRAIGRACQVPVDEHYQIRVVPSGRTASLIGQATSSLKTGQGLAQPFEVIDPLQFRVWIRRGLAGFQRHSAETFLEMIFKELPSEVTFPSSSIANGGCHLQESTEEVRTADSLVFLIDALEPRTDLWYEHLPTLLSSFRESNARDLRADRILVLLSRVDLLCNAVMRPHRLAEKASPSSFNRPIRATPADLAHAIDSLEQACEVLGKPILKVILDALKPGASLAVGIVSAGGFAPKSGEPLLDATGRSCSCQGRANSSVLRLWEPYGIREVVLYLALGQAESPIVPLSHADLAQAAGITIDEIREGQAYGVDR